MNVLNHQIDLAPESGALHGFVPIVVALLLRAGLMALSIPGWDAAMSISSNDPVPSAVPAIGVAARSRCPRKRLRPSSGHGQVQPPCRKSAIIFATGSRPTSRRHLCPPA